MFQSGTEGDRKRRLSDLKPVISPDAGFMAHLAAGLTRSSSARRRADPETASAIYGAVADRFGSAWPQASVSRSI